MGLNIFTKSFNFSKIAKFKCDYMIELFGVKLDQPATVATNIALFIICTYCAISVMRSPAGRYDFVKKYSLFLLFTGIAALLGGIFSHGFKYYFGLSYSFPGWLIALGGAYYASIAAFRHALANELWQDIKPTTIKITEQILMLLLIVFMVLTYFYMNFLVVTIYTAVCISVIGLYLEMKIFRKTQNRGSKNYMWGIGIGVLVLFVYIFKLGISPEFNHNDVAHIIMMISMVVLMKGFKGMSAAKLT
mgnify:FL=1